MDKVTALVGNSNKGHNRQDQKLKKFASLQDANNYFQQFVTHQYLLYILAIMFNESVIFYNARTTHLRPILRAHGVFYVFFTPFSEEVVFTEEKLRSYCHTPPPARSLNKIMTNATPHKETYAYQTHTASKSDVSRLNVN